MPEDAATLEALGRSAGLTPVLAAKLTGAQLHDVLTRQPPMRGDPPAVAVVAVVGFFATLVVTVVAVLYAIYRLARQKAETLRLMVEKGVAIPAELLAPPSRPANDLKRGVLLVSLGLGLAVFLFAAVEAKGLWTMGLIPLLMGLGYLLSHRLARPAGPSSGATAPAAAG